MTITNKFPGRCSCGAAVAAGGGQAIKGADGKWSVRCAACASGTPASAAPSSATSRTITVERVGRRSYLRGDTLPVRGLLRDGGCHWDDEQRAWWIGSDAEAQALAQRAQAAPAEAAPKKRITHCVGCGAAFDHFQLTRGFKFCSSDCATEARMGSGWSGRVAGGGWHQGSDD